MVPDCLRVRPRIARSNTDFPDPEAPTKPRISPRRTSRSRCSSTVFSPKATVMSRAESRTSGRRAAASSILPVSVAKGSLILEIDRRIEHRKQAIYHDDDEDRLYDRGRDPASERFGAAADLHAFRRGNDADDERHEGRLDETGHDRVHADPESQPLDECRRLDVRIEPGDKDRP